MFPRRKDPPSPGESRREMLVLSATSLAGLMFGGRPGAFAAAAAGPVANTGVEPTEEEVSPGEDLMREHGVLNRILLVYEEGIHRLESDPRSLPPAVLLGAADIVRKFIEDYHEKLEEDFLFPRFERAGRLADLVATLRAQHRSGRRLTDEIRGRAADRDFARPEERQALAGSLRRFIRMYRPHEAREDTVLFPALRKVVTPHELGALGEDFERREHERFGEDGFERIVEEVAGLERRLGIHDLARFTA